MHDIEVVPDCAHDIPTQPPSCVTGGLHGVEARADWSPQVAMAAQIKASMMNVLPTWITRP